MYLDNDNQLNITENEIVESPSGITSTFVQWGNTGLKIFRSEKSRNLSYSNQARLADLGYAPKVGYKMHIIVNGSTEYAYETEIARVADRKYYYDLLINGESEKARLYANEYKEGIRSLQRDLSGIINWVDDHMFNVGFIDSNPVLIDCADDIFGSGEMSL